jgi:hypothetical protein
MRGISCLDMELSASKHGLYSNELFKIICRNHFLMLSLLLLLLLVIIFFSSSCSRVRATCLLFRLYKCWSLHLFLCRATFLLSVRTNSYTKLVTRILSIIHTRSVHLLLSPTIALFKLNFIYIYILYLILPSFLDLV